MIQENKMCMGKEYSKWGKILTFMDSRWVNENVYNISVNLNLSK